MARFLRLLLKLVGALLVIAALLGGLLACELRVAVGPTQPEFVQLKPGASARHIAADLRRAGMIKSQTAFLIWHYFRGHKPLKAGEYSFDHPANVMQVYDRVARGDIYFRTVVVPEGFNSFDIAAALEDAGLGKRAEFLQVVQQEAALIKDLDPDAPSLEGYLFPDTYNLTRTQSMRDIAGVMVHRFRQVAAEIGLNKDIHSMVTMGSIVEKETSAPEERARIAGVFFNRLERKMTLDTDPSVIYAALLNNRYQGTIHKSDLKFNSPYNTYRFGGLPPGPICNPGKDSLRAAMNPAKTQYLYFVSDNHGHSRFARTQKEHQRNVRLYRRSLAQSR
jgi:peptidoglycan lytic transglycosylase G